MLRAWCGPGAAASVRVLVGAGGVGKTRLAWEIAAGWAARGGPGRLVAGEREAEAVEAARGVTAELVLLVVDYAETRYGPGGAARADLA